MAGLLSVPKVSAPAAPVPTPLAPVQDVAATTAALQKQAALASTQSGRLSTILSQTGTNAADKLGN